MTSRELDLEVIEGRAIAAILPIIDVADPARGAVAVLQPQGVTVGSRRPRRSRHGNRNGH
jgi:hypothetical protein